MNRNEAAEYALDALKKAGAQAAHCWVSTGRTEELNAHEGQFSLMRTLFNSSLSLKVVKDSKKGTVSINKLDRDEIDGAVSACIAAADAAKPDEAEGIAEKAENKSFVSGVLTPDRETLFERIDEYLTEVREKYPKINIEEFTSKYNFSERRYINTNGADFNITNGYYDYGCMFSGKDGKQSTSFNGYGASFADVSTKLMDLGLTRMLLEDTVNLFNPKAVDGKFVGHIILTPSSLEDFLRMTMYNFLYEPSLIDGTSPWKDKLDASVAHPSLTVRSMPYDSRVVNGERVTADGYESRDMDIIAGGILKNFLLSRYGANKTGKPRSANLSMSLIVEPGTAAYQDMIKSIDRGLVVGRFSGGSPSSNGDFSGVAKNSFLIENGKIAGPVNETMISGNLADLLLNISAISRETVCDGSSVMPWVSCNGVTVSGK